MTHTRTILAALLSIRSATILLAAPPPPETALVRFDGAFDIDAIPKRDVTVARGDGDTLNIRSGHAKTWPGIDLRPKNGHWDLSKHRYLALDVRNRGSNAVTVCCRVDNPAVKGKLVSNQGSIEIAPGRSDILLVDFKRHPEAPDIEIIGMRAGPFGIPHKSTTIDPGNVVQLVVFVPRPKAEHHFTIGNVRAGGIYVPPAAPTDPEKLFPFIDELGQYIHKDWPGKTRSAEEMRTSGQREEAGLARYPGPADRNRYGGWTAGPRLEATGWFRATKHGGKWWLVDPEGRLFWSHGLDCVHPGAATPVTDREHYYEALPDEGGPLAQFYGRGSWAPHGYYKNRSPYRTYDFTRANLLRKHGDEWKRVFADLTHRRLKSWGLNTIANWSSHEIYRMRKTPYVATLSIGAPTIEGSEGYWGKFYDVFDPRFRKALAKRLGWKKAEASDPWCIGFFIDNELSWGKDDSLALGALKSPADQAAKRALVSSLKAKYGTVAKLNAAWGTSHASWDALLACREAPDAKKARADLTAFYTRVAETYFATVKEEVKKAAPNHLYLGCRFAWVNDLAAVAATKYCDVVSYNRYRSSVGDHLLPTGIDMPTIIGEFHFGALDRGMFHTGLRKARDQEHRAELYEDYVRGALKNPQIVGTHWFQYKDQATTGRGDGENYQIGFVDVCDRPYPEIVAAARRVGLDMYPYRLRDR
jgi:hypothetical protein